MFDEQRTDRTQNSTTSGSIRRWRLRLAMAAAALCGSVGSVVALSTAASAATSSVSFSANSYLSANNAAIWTVTFTPASSFGNSDYVDVQFPPGFNVTSAVATLGTGFTGCSAGAVVPTTSGGNVVAQVPLTGSCTVATSSPITLTLTGISAAATQYSASAFSVTTYSGLSFSGPIDGSQTGTSNPVCQTSPNPPYSGIFCNILASLTYSTLTSQGTATTSGSAPVDGSSPYSTVSLPPASGPIVTVLGNTGNLALAGYTFAGWCPTDNAADPTLCTAGPAATAGSTFPIPGNVTLFSVWTLAPTYTVTYNANTTISGSVPVDASSPYASGATVTVKGNAGNLGCGAGSTFSGWNTLANGSGTPYAASGSATFTITANTTLYAQCAAAPVPPRCSPGQYLAGSSCTSCPLGYFADNYGQTACSPAPAGSYVATTGATSATLCTAGTYSTATGSTTCSAAGLNFFASGTGTGGSGATSETACPPGTSTGGLTGSSSSAACKATAVNTTTSLTLSTATIGLASENTEVFTVTVKEASGSAKPSGTATVENGTTKLCSATLKASGVGTCTLTAGKLAAGSYTTNASYSGVTGKFDSSKSKNVDLTVKNQDQLALTTAPNSPVVAGLGFSFAVTAEGSGGSINSSFSGKVAVAITSGPSGAELSGVTSAAAVNGVATFFGTAASTLGSYTLTASASGLTPVTIQLSVVEGSTAGTAEVTTDGVIKLGGAQVHPFGVGYTGPISMVTGNFSGQGKVDIAVTPGVPGQTETAPLNIIKIYNASGSPLQQLAEPSSATSFSIAAGNFGWGKDDLVVSAGPGGPPEVWVYDAVTGKDLKTFYAYDHNGPSDTAGVTVALGDVLGDGVDQIVTGAGPSGGAQVKVFSLTVKTDGIVSVQQSNQFFAYSNEFNGVAVSTADLNASTVSSILTASGPGGSNQSAAFQALNSALFDTSFTFNPATGQFSSASYTGAPLFTSPDKATATVGKMFSFTVDTGGVPSPTITESGPLPAWASFTDNRNGTATLSGTPTGTGGVYDFTLTATNAYVSSNPPQQSFELSVDALPSFTSALSVTTEAAGSGVQNGATVTPLNFGVKTTGYPAATISISGASQLPDGVTLVNSGEGDGTATLEGTPVAGSGGQHTVMISATNSLGTITKPFTLTVPNVNVYSLNSGGLCDGDGSTDLLYCPAAGIPALIIKFVCNLKQCAGPLLADSYCPKGDVSRVSLTAGMIGTIKCTVPAGSAGGTDQIGIDLTQGGNSESGPSLAWRASTGAPVLPPVITSIDSSTCFGRTVSEGVTIGFTACPEIASSIIINGRNFFYTTTVTPGLCSSLYYESSSQLLCLLEPTAPGTVTNVEAFTPGMGPSSATSFSVTSLAAPVITSIADAACTGTAIGLVLNGCPSVGGSVLQINVNGTALPSATLTKGLCSNVAWVNASSILCTVSSGIAPGSSLRVTVTELSGTSQSDVTISF